MNQYQKDYDPSSNIQSIIHYANSNKKLTIINYINKFSRILPISIQLLDFYSTNRYTEMSELAIFSDIVSRYAMRHSLWINGTVICDIT